MEDKMLLDIAEVNGTPLYVFDGDCIIFSYKMLKNALPRDFEILYSIKANPLLGICELFKELGSGIEVASSGELYTALAAGFPPDKIIFTSPGKTLDELEYAIETGIYSINIESVEEAKLINEIAGRKCRNVNISLRVNPDFDFTGSSIKMSGVPTQFGIAQGQLDDAFKVIKQLPNVSVIGIHVYMGTQITSAQNILENMDKTIKLALDLAEANNFKLKLLDLGGGFGIPYFKGEHDLDMQTLQEGLSDIWSRYEHKLAGTRVAVESGRFLMAESGVYLVKALYVKECKGSKYIICDGGSSQHASSAFLGRHVRNNFPMHILNKRGADEEVNITGPLCTPTDVIGQKVQTPEVVPGDILAIEKSGAYGLTQSPALFLSHPLPMEVIHYKGRTQILRERGKKEDFLRGQKNLNAV
ncbi:MAG TPA: type III PLP-dependent enzyme [Clostridia bacterium]|nr:type III PLP-dependent enzyme [Clostridia bacterium]